MDISIIPPRYAPYLHTILRIVTGLLFMEHGTGKLLNFPPIHDQMLNMMGSGMLYFTGTFELVGGALIAIGLITRPVAFVLSGFMAAGYFLAHFPKSFFPAINGGDAAVLFSFVFLYISTVGAGPVSVDAALGAGSTDGSRSWTGGLRTQ